MIRALILLVVMFATSLNPATSFEVRRSWDQLRDHPANAAALTGIAAEVLFELEELEETGPSGESAEPAHGDLSLPCLRDRAMRRRLQRSVSLLRATALAVRAQLPEDRRAAIRRHRSSHHVPRQGPHPV